MRKLVLPSLLVVALASPVFADYGLVDVRNYSSFVDAITALGSNPTTLVIPTTQAVAQDVTVPANVTLSFTSGGQLDVGSGVTVTIIGSIQAPITQIFAWTGTGKVHIGYGHISEVYFQWWGAKCDGATDDSPAFQAAINAINVGTPQGSGIPIRFVKGSAACYFGSSVTTTGSLTIIGSLGSDGPGIVTDQAIDVLRVNMQGNGWPLHLEGFSIGGGNTGIHVLSSSGYLARNSTFRDLTITGQSNASLKIEALMIGTRHQNLTLGQGPQYGIYAEGDDLLGASVWDTVYISYTTAMAVILWQTTSSPWDNTQFRNLVVEYNYGYGVYIGGAYVSLDNPHFEMNGSGGIPNIPDIVLSKGDSSSGRLHVNGGYFSTAHPDQNNVRIRHASESVRVSMAGTNFSGNALLNAGGYTAASYVGTFNTAGLPGVINFNPAQVFRAGY